jgi:hypothetical protein
MYNGVKAMIEKEKELTPKQEKVKKEKETLVVGSHLKTPEDLTGFPTFPPETKSLLSKYLTKEIWKKLKLTKDKYGFSFKQAIFSGC